MPEKRLTPLSAQTLWKIDRIGGLSLAPDGVRAVCAVTRFDADKNDSRSALWLLDTRAEVTGARGLAAVGRDDVELRRVVLLAGLLAPRQEGDAVTFG